MHIYAMLSFEIDLKEPSSFWLNPAGLIRVNIFTMPHVD